MMSKLNSLKKPQDMSKLNVGSEILALKSQSTDNVIEAIFEDIRAHSRFEHDLFFLSQLYDLTWRPIPTI